MAEDLHSQLKKYEDLQKNLKKQLSASKTAYTRGVAPTQQDIKTNIALIQARRAEDKMRGTIAKETRAGYLSPAEIKERGEEQNEGYISRTLDLLGLPLYGIVGGAEAVLKKGTKKGLANIAQNIKEKETFGDLLRKYNVSNSYALPLGFAMDVFFDPVNWATVGTAAFLPKVAMGAYKGGLKGVAVGVKASTLGKAAFGSRIIPGLKTQKASLVKRAAEERNLYDKMVGRSLEEHLAKEPIARKYLVEPISKMLKKTPKGRAAIEKFKYDPNEWFRAKKLETLKKQKEVEEGIHIAGTPEEIARKAKESITGEASISSSLDNLATHPPTTPLNTLRQESTRILDEGGELATDYSHLARTFDAEESAYRLMGEFENDEVLRETVDAIRRLSSEETGWKWYDDLRKTFKNFKVRDVAVGKKIINTYEKFIGLFKTAKIGASPTAWINATVGNPTMAFMAGIDITDPNLYKYVGQSFNLSIGRINKRFIENFTSPDWQEFAKQEGLFKGVFGISPSVVFGEGIVDDAIREARRTKVKLPRGVEPGDIAEVQRTIDDTKDSLEILTERALRRGAAAREVGSPRIFQGEIRPGELGLSFIRADVETKAFRKMITSVKASADKGNPAAKAFYWYLTKPLSGYEKIDQSYKLGTALLLSKKGVTPKELFLLNKSVKIRPEEVVIDATTGLHRIKAEKAGQIANEIYMNYAAMPAAVKVLRSLPFFGSPFACRDEGTEILTKRGWKKYYELNIGEEVMSLNQETKVLEWNAVEDIHTYDYDGDLVNIKGKYLDILATSNHDCLVAKPKLRDVRGKQEDKEFVIEKRKAEDLAVGNLVATGASGGYAGQKKKIISDELVELAGWLVTEGYWIYKIRKNKNKHREGIRISQAKLEGIERIKDLRKRLGLSNSKGVYIKKIENVNKYDEYKKYKRKIKSSLDCYTFAFPVKYRDIMMELCPNKQLTVNFLNKLTRKQLHLLFDTLILADGTREKGNKISFYQLNNETLHTFQILCLMLGRVASICKHSGTPCYKVGVQNKIYRIIRKNNLKKKRYKSLVWCPQVKNNNNWVARSNGKIDVTGNSFMYAMASKTGKTIAYNPAAFNKVQFFMKELSGGRSPLEKEALSSPYYQWFNQTGMLNIPFWGENPIYMNVANMIPYYSMNIFEPTERKYRNTLGSGLASIVDKSPLLKTPEGQVMFDYFILPLMLKETNPRGSFNQLLWPTDAGALKKIGYGTRALAEAVVPPAPALLGTITPEKYLEFIPSYRWRQLGYAARGKTSVGALSKEPAAQRTARAIVAAYAGLPLYEMKLQYQK